jgi:transcription initiation factor IIE alpha subunit
MTINLDRKRVYIHCPRCNFWARPFLRQIRHRETIVCAGCKSNLRLVDHLGSFPKAQRQMNRALEDLKEQLGTININIRL